VNPLPALPDFQKLENGLEHLFENLKNQ